MKSVRELMKNPVVTVSKNDTAARARNLMLREGVGRLIVVEGSFPIGIITKKDLVADLAKYKMRNRELDSITVLELMKVPVKVVNEDASVEDAAKMMVDANIRGMPVVDSEGRLVGIITKTDMTSYYRLYYRGVHKVNEIARKMEETPVVRRTHSLYRVIDLMELHSADRVIVEEGGKPIGIITETDLSFIRPNRSAPSFIKGVSIESEDIYPVRLYQLPTAEALMTHDPIVIEEFADAVDAAAVLLDNGIGGMPMVNNENDLVGVVTKFDFVRAISMGASA